MPVWQTDGSSLAWLLELDSRQNKTGQGNGQLGNTTDIVRQCLVTE